MKKKYEKPKMKMVKLTRRTPLLGSSWDSDYTAPINHEPGGQGDFD